MSTEAGESKAEGTESEAEETESGAEAAESKAEASRIVLSYPSDLTDWDRDQVETPWYVGYLRKVIDEPDVDDVYEEFVDIGCCGTSREVPLKVEEIGGGSRVGEGTEVEYTVRESCDLPGAWDVQDGGS
jgi:hypothetical protein